MTDQDVELADQETEMTDQDFNAVSLGTPENSAIQKLSIIISMLEFCWTSFTVEVVVVVTVIELLLILSQAVLV